MRHVPAHRVAVAVAAAAIAVAVPAAAHAQPDAAGVLDASRVYLDGEYAQGAAWGAVGAVSVTVGAFGLASDSDLARGAAYPMLAVGAIQLGAAVFSYFGPPRRLRRARAAIARDPGGYRTRELARMKRIELGFEILAVAEVTLAVAGVGIAIAGGRAERDVWVGVGGGLAFQAIAMIALDASAHARAARYLDKLSLRVDDRGTAMVFTTAF